MQGSAATVRRRAGPGHGLARDRPDPPGDVIVRCERDSSAIIPPPPQGISPRTFDLVCCYELGDGGLAPTDGTEQ